MSALLTRSGFNRQKTAKARAKGAESEGQAKRRSAPSHPPASQCLLEWLPPTRKSHPWTAGRAAVGLFLLHPDAVTMARAGPL